MAPAKTNVSVLELSRSTKKSFEAMPRPVDLRRASFQMPSENSNVAIAFMAPNSGSKEEKDARETTARFSDLRSAVLSKTRGICHLESQSTSLRQRTTTTRSISTQKPNFARMNAGTLRNLRAKRPDAKSGLWSQDLIVKS